jgi:hypothetical protein
MKLKELYGPRLETVKAIFAKYVPSHLIPFSFLEKVRNAAKASPFWGLMFRTADGKIYEFDLAEIEKEIGPFTIHQVSDCENENGDGGRFGATWLGMFENEQNHLFGIKEKDGGGTGATHFSMHPTIGLLIGLIPEVRNRKYNLSGFGGPRGYDKETLLGLQERVSASQTALEESWEEGTGFKGMKASPILGPDNRPIKIDQNSGVFCSGSGEGFKLEAIQWPIALLVEDKTQRGVWIPDLSNEIVSQGKGEKDAGHTGEMFFLRFDDLLDHALLKGWDPKVSDDSLMISGAYAVRAQLKRQGKFVG